VTLVENVEAAVAEPRRRSRRRVDVGLALSVVFLAAVALAAALAPLIATWDPSSVDLSQLLVGPGNGGHLLGTDAAGRDTLARLVYGARISLVAPLIVVVASTLLGTVIGLTAGWRGGIVDGVLGRAMDVVFAFPGLLLAMLAVALFGSGLVAPVVALSIAYTPFTARLARNLAAQERTRPYVDNYRLQGFSASEILARGVFPNLAPLLLAQCALAFGWAFIDLAALSFLGFGAQPPTADWGVMVADAQQAIMQSDAWAALFPCLAIILTVVSFNVVGDRLGERLGRLEVQ
jgi:peptide/nickel transport system permease protein